MLYSINLWPNIKSGRAVPSHHGVIERRLLCQSSNFSSCTVSSASTERRSRRWLNPSSVSGYRPTSRTSRFAGNGISNTWRPSTLQNEPVTDTRSACEAVRQYEIVEGLSLFQMGAVSGRRRHPRERDQKHARRPLLGRHYRAIIHRSNEGNSTRSTSGEFSNRGENGNCRCAVHVHCSPRSRGSGSPFPRSEAPHEIWRRHGRRRKGVGVHVAAASGF
jgi:hypothetical protein